LALCTTCGRWRAAHLALLHLFKDQLQRLSPGQHAFDIHPLFARDVIEFKHYRVRLAAGHATRNLQYPHGDSNPVPGGENPGS